MMFRAIKMAGVALVGLTAANAAWAEVPVSADPVDDQRRVDPPEEITVDGHRIDESFAGTKTDTPLIQVPQPITVITDDVFLAQGAITISDTVRYAAGVNSDAYGRDTRVDSFQIRGVDALQFRDGMRDIYSFYASITSDPYNFSRVEVVRGPASVLFGQGSLGGIVNLVSKTPVFTNAGEVNLVYGSYDRKEVMADVNRVIGDDVAVRLVARVRDADTYVDHVPDDRVMIAPSITWRPSDRTDVTLLGLYQEDDTGSTANFLPLVGTVRDNPGNPRLPRYLFVGKPGYDRYDGRLLQGAGLFEHRFTDALKLSLKARYIDSDLAYYGHYTNSYANPENPYITGSNGRRIDLFTSSSDARLNVFSTDNNVQAKFNTGTQVEHTLLLGLDYSWNEVRKRSIFQTQTIDIYNIDYDAILAPEVTGPFDRNSQRQRGLYAQDQIRFWDRVSVVLGVRNDRLRTRGATAPDVIDKATTFRAGIIGEIGAGISPFFSYTESFQPVAGTLSSGANFRPQTGTQYETGLKWQPDPQTLVTLTGFRIKEQNRPIPDPTNPLFQIQAGELTTKGFEFEATRTLPGNYDLTVSYGYNDLSGDSAATGYLSKHTAAAWGTKTVALAEDTSLRVGAGVRYLGKQVSSSSVWTIVTPDRVMADALVELNRDRWRIAVNATNLFDNRAFASCLARGDCFVSAPRNVMATLGYRF